MTDQPRLYLACRHRLGRTVITAVGTITKATVMQLRTELLQALARHEHSLLLDLAGVDHIDDAGLDALRRTVARARLLGGQLRLVAPCPPVAERLRTSDLRRHVAVDATITGTVDTSSTTPVPGMEDPPADWLEQQQPADPTELIDGDGADDQPTPGTGLPVDADPADFIDQHIPVPVNEEDYPAGT